MRHREKAIGDFAREAAKNISEGYTIYGKPGVWYDDYASRFGNASCRDPFNELVFFLAYYYYYYYYHYHYYHYHYYYYYASRFGDASCRDPFNELVR